MTSDTHYPFSEDMFPSGDVLIHAGDLMYTGYEGEWQPRLDSLAKLNYMNKLLVPGNHDYHIERYAGVARAELRKQAKVFCLDNFTPMTTVNGLNILGIPFVTGLSGWAYSADEDWLLSWLNAVTEQHYFYPDIVVSHQPPYNTLDAVYPNRDTHILQNHVGSLALHRWFHSLKRKPKMWVCGHIHESYGQRNIEGTEFFNVAMCDRNYDQTNAPMVWDIEVEK
jgi:Icc-related predicted phosphoesterase